MENETIDDHKINANKVKGGKNEVQLIDASSQTEFVVIDVDLPELKKRMAGEVQEPLTAESIAKTAQSVMNKSGWVYDPATRTYFDYNTNLYYYPQTRLYYNYKNGCYYRYNQETQKYEFHYQLDAFKGQSKGIQELSAEKWKKRIRKLKFQNVKRLKLKLHGDITKVEAQVENCEERKANDTEEFEHSRERYAHYNIFCKRKVILENLTKRSVGHLSDSEKDCSKKQNSAYLICKNCANICTTICCNNGKLARWKMNTDTQEMGYYSDTEVYAINVAHSKYVKCKHCKRFTQSTCCQKTNFWLDKVTKRKRTGRRKRRKRRRVDSGGSFTGKENGNSSSSRNGDSFSQDEDFSGVVQGNQIDYTFTNQSEVFNPGIDADKETTVVPCIRAMVTSSETLKVGTLFIITCNSEATIGSGNDCDIQIEENGISDKHATLKYFQQQNNYFVTDHGSETGTTLNSTTENNPGTTTVLATPVTHKSVLLIGSCIFVLHLHLGYETCDDCEPGQIQAMLGNDQPIEPVHTLTKREKDAIRRSELKNIQKRYDLHNEKYRQRKALIGPQYMDRAAERRRTVGSDNPFEKDEMPTSYDTELADHNKGHQMLKKMGWSKGKSLGKSQEGITEPIIPQGTGKGKSGLGFGTAKSRGAR